MRRKEIEMREREQSMRERIGEQAEKGPRPYRCPKTAIATTTGYFGAGTATK